MKHSTKLFSIVAVLAALLAAVPAVAQAPSFSKDSFNTGTYYSPNYGLYQVRVVIGNGSTGAGTSIVVQGGGGVALPDGRVIVPFATNVPLLVDLGPNQETVTPTGVSGCFAAVINNEQAATCTITGTFNNIHGRGALVQSGDQGMMEAINDAANNGGGLVYFQADTGIVTLSTGSTTTNSVSIPGTFMSSGASCRVTTTITTAANYSLGTSAVTTAFVNANTNITAGNPTQTSFLSSPAKVGAAVSEPTSGLTPLVITTNVNPGAGAVHCKAWGFVPVQSNF